MMKQILTFLLLIIISNSYAQSTKEKILLEGGYTYFNKSFADVGVKYLIDKENLMLGANALIGFSDGKMLVIPEINATKYFNADKFPFPFARLNVSPKTITPQFGFSFLMVELGVGYGFGFNPSELYKTSGFRASLNFNIPLKFKLKLF